MTRLYLISVLLLVTAWVAPLQGQPEKSKQKTSRQVAQDVEPIHISTSVDSKQTIIQVIKKGSQRSFPLNIPDGYQLTIHFQEETPRYFLYIYQYNNFDSGDSQLLIIDKENLTLVKRQSIHSFNISQPLVHNDVVFVAAAGYAAELELSTGDVQWEFKNLFGRPHYFDGVLSGETIEVLGDLVQFGPNFSVNRRTQKIVVRQEEQ